MRIVYHEWHITATKHPSTLKSSTLGPIRLHLPHDMLISSMGHLPQVPNGGTMDSARPSFSAKSGFAQQSLRPSLESHYVAALHYINPYPLPRTWEYRTAQR
jgi:hypothetical protein